MRINRPRDERGMATIVGLMVGASIGSIIMMSALAFTAKQNEIGVKTDARAATTNQAVELANRIRKSVQQADTIADVTDDRLVLDTTDAYGTTTRTAWTATVDGRVIESSTSGPAATIAGLPLDAELPEVRVQATRLGAADVSFTAANDALVEYTIGSLSTAAALR